MSEIDRRTLMRGTALSCLSFTVAGQELLLSPRQAKAQQASFQTLKPDEIETLEAVGETLLPGAREAGIAHFIDQQVTGAPQDCLLMARIANVKPPFANFYRAAVAGLQGAVSTAFGQRFAALKPAEQKAAADRLRQGKLENWAGPPQSFVYFLLRQDAVDVVFGTVEGFEKLGIPYMAHILPGQRW